VLLQVIMIEAEVMATNLVEVMTVNLAEVFK
jgi:hypothetical protein